ncbi:MAG TPA: LacI family DNA-binding transcriptional regulator [Ktedonobacteraceae bacterium]|jgi:LacI family transcriptional regulator
MGHSITIKDIARQAEVSIATVSRVLNNQGSTKEELRQRVLQAAADLGYFKTADQGPVARNEKRALKAIGFILAYSDLEDPPLDTFWSHILHGAEIEARKSNTYVTYYGVSLKQPPYLLLSKLHEMRVDGILLVGSSDLETVLSIQEANFPLVLVDNAVHIPGQQIDAILSDNYEGAREAVNYLISEGHRQIAFLGGPTSDTIQSSQKMIYTFERRRDGYLAALSEAGLPVHRELVVEDCYVNNPAEVYAACKRLIASKIPFSAVFCANDPIADKTIKALRELSLNVPDDVSVIGFDNADIAEHLTPPLTTVHVHKEAMGAMAVKSLFARIADPEAIGMTNILAVELIKRKSVRSLVKESETIIVSPN